MNETMLLEAPSKLSFDHQAEFVGQGTNMLHLRAATPQHMAGMDSAMLTGSLDPVSDLDKNRSMLHPAYTPQCLPGTASWGASDSSGDSDQDVMGKSTFSGHAEGGGWASYWSKTKDRARCLSHPSHAL